MLAIWEEVVDAAIMLSFEAIKALRINGHVDRLCFAMPKGKLCKL